MCLKKKLTCAWWCLALLAVGEATGPGLVPSVSAHGFPVRVENGKAVTEYEGTRQASRSRTSETQDDARAFNRIVEVVENWSPSQHLYVQGNVGVAADQLRGLEAWLDSNAPHWTVVLMQTARSQEYRAADGRRFRELDAVEYALGHGLSNQTEFGLWEHPRTAETDGAVFVLFLEERQFSYFGSDAQDRRQLGESRWRGELDRPAVEAMRNGGRILDAVKNTILSIDEKLERAIEREEAAAREQARAEAAAERERARAVSRLSEQIDLLLNEELPRLTERLQTLIAEFPSLADSKIGKVSVTPWRESLQALREGLDETNVRQRDQELARITDELHAMTDLIQQFRLVDVQLKELDRRWETLAFYTGTPIGEQYSVPVRRLLDQARAERDAGDPEFAVTLKEAVNQLEQGEQAVLEHLEAQRADANRRRLVRSSVLVSLGGVAVLISLVLMLWNWRRRSVLKRAWLEFNKRDDLVGQLEQRMTALNDVVDSGMGAPLPRLRERYQGQTRALIDALDAGRSAVSAGVLEIRRVSEEAQRLLLPASPIAQFANLVSGARYHACLSLLSEKSLNAAVLAEWTESLSEGTAATWVTFDEFSQRLSDRFENLNGQCGRLQAGLKMPTEALRELGRRLAELQATEDRLEALERQDGLFPVDQLEQEWLPKSQKQLVALKGLVAHDPNRVHELEYPALKGELDRAFTLIQLIEETRSNHLPGIWSQAERLKQSGRRVDWIRERLQQSGDRLNTLFREIDAEPFENSLETIRGDLASLAGEVRELNEIVGEIENRLRGQVAAERASVNETRTRLAEGLRLRPEQLLSEPGLNPDESVEQSEEQIQFALAAVDRGVTAAASEALMSARHHVEQAAQLCQAARLAVKEFPDLRAQVGQQIRDLQTLLPTVRVAVGRAESQFAASALIMRTVNQQPDGPRTDGRSAVDGPRMAGVAGDGFEDLQFGESIQRRLGRIEQEFQERTAAAELANQAFQSGAVLTAANDLGLLKQELEWAMTLTREVLAHCRRLEQLVEENRQLANRLKQEADALLGELSDPRAQLQTQVAAKALRGQIQVWQNLRQSDTVGLDPFDDERALGNIHKALNEVRHDFERDQRLYRETGLALQGAENELAACQRLIQQSESDRVPDSQTILRCRQAVEEWSQRIGKLRQMMQIPHGDWLAIHEQADSSTAELGVVAGSLVREIQLAGQAAEDFQRASRDVMRAAGWRGAYGVSVSGDPGSLNLEGARHCLAEGDYDGAIRLSRIATRISQQAIAEAERLVAEAGRQIELEARQRRRHLQKRSQANHIGTVLEIGRVIGSVSRGIQWGGGSSSSRSSSRGRSSGGSSRRSSGGGSGFGRSGW